MKMIIGVLCLLLCQVSFAQEDGKISAQVKIEELPIPHEKGQLFYLQRDPDSNTVVYTFNVENGIIDERNPISAYWIRYAEEGQRKNLSFIQRKMAYGIQHKKIAPEVFELRVQAYKALLITLSLNTKTKRPQATVQVNGKKAILDRIFVRINGGSFFRPNVEFIEIFGHSIVNGQKISHRFTP